eukprot:COSAG02_NODE_12093_length_1598_cov_89.144763_2_plen_145_part_00
MPRQLQVLPRTTALCATPVGMVQVGAQSRSALVTVPRDATPMPRQLPLPRTIVLRATPAGMVQVGAQPRSAPVTVPRDATPMPRLLPVLPRTTALRATPAGMVKVGAQHRSAPVPVPKADMAQEAILNQHAERAVLVDTAATVA